MKINRTLIEDLINWNNSPVQKTTHSSGSEAGWENMVVKGFW